MKMRVENKVAIITGSGRGIGKAIALALAKEGCNVAVTARTSNEINQVAKEIKELGIEVLAVKADVSKSTDVRNLVKKTIRKFGRIDILVNNAGIVVIKPLVETTEKEWDDVININLKGAYLCSKEVLPYMIKQGNGVIVSISSGAGHYTFKNLSAYCASKFGLLALTGSLAKEVNNYGIRIFAICPGRVSTDMQIQFVGRERFKIFKHFMIQPEKIANKVLELCSNSDKFNSGSCFDIYL